MSRDRRGEQCQLLTMMEMSSCLLGHIHTSEAEVTITIDSDVDGWVHGMQDHHCPGDIVRHDRNEGWDHPRSMIWRYVGQ